MSKRSKSSTSARLKRPERRQPLHVVYGGAHLFKAGTIQKLSSLALKAFEERLPHPLALAEIFKLPGPIAERIHPRIREKLARQAIEDYRIDFEDGFGMRPSDEEDREAARVAGELAGLLSTGQSPCSFGIRIKSLRKETASRSLRTLKLFLRALRKELPERRFPGEFTVTLPKVSAPAEVTRLSRESSALERALGIPAGTLRLEVMLELPDLLPKLGGAIRAGGSRVIGVHFGPYDYLSACGVAAASQRLSHPACLHARLVAQACLVSSGIDLVDGASHRMPLGESSEVLSAWREAYQDVRAALDLGWWQGWDLHPAQIVPRLVAVFSYFSESAPQACSRLKGYLDQAARAGRTGNFFDDAASAQAVHRLLARGLESGAILPAELSEQGLDADAIASRGFQELARTVAGSGETRPL